MIMNNVWLFTNSGKTVKEVADQEYSIRWVCVVYTMARCRSEDGGRTEGRNRLFADQRGLIEKYVDKDVTKVPQVFIPYKEVLDILSC